MVAAPVAAPPRLASALLRWPRARRRRLSAFPCAPPPRSAARTLAGRVTAQRCTTANKPALAGPGEIKNKTNKLAKRLESWGGACAAARRGPGDLGPGAAKLRWQARHRSRLRPPGLRPEKHRAWASGLQGRWGSLGAPVAGSARLHSLRWECGRVCGRPEKPWLSAWDHPHPPWQGALAGVQESAA